MNKIKAKEILEARYRGLSLNEIAKTLHIHDPMIDVIYYNHYSCWQVNRLKETIKRAEYHFR